MLALCWALALVIDGNLMKKVLTRWEDEGQHRDLRIDLIFFHVLVIGVLVMMYDSLISTG